nr:hypothetical protein [Tanacetum cinerariifolium]
MPCEALSREISSPILRLLHTAKTLDLVWIWLGGDYENVFLMGFNAIQWVGLLLIIEDKFTLRYALTVKPTVYVSYIRQFWSTARIETTEEGTQILATVDGIHRTVTESSLRRNLKLKDEEGISSLPDMELFENLTLMGYNISLNQKFTFQKGFNEFNSNIATALVCLATNKTYNFLKLIFDGLVKKVNNKVSKFLMYPRFLTMRLRMSQFGQITHTYTYVVPFHTRKLFTTLRVNSPSFSGRIVPLFDTMLVQHGEGSGTPTEPHHTPSLEGQPPSHTTHSSSSLPPVTTTIPTITPSKTPPIRQYTRRARIAQSSTLPTVADEPESPLSDISQGEACATDSGVIADQDRATIAKSSTLSHDLAPRVTFPAAAEGNMQQTINELMARLKLLEDRQGVASEGSRDDTSIKGRSLDEGEAAAERTSNDTEEMATVLTSMDVATVLASRATEVPTCSGSISTAGPPATKVPTGSDVVPTASLVFATATVVTPYRRRKGKEVMVESKTPKKTESSRANRCPGCQRARRATGEKGSEKVYHQFALELPIERRIELISDLVKYQENYAKIYKFQSQQRKPLNKKQKKDYYMAVIRSNLGWKVKDFKGMTFKEVEAKFNSVWKQMEDIILMGLKEEAERIKRKGLSLEQESTKKQKTSKDVTKEAKSPDEVPEEKDKEIFMLVEKEYPLRKGLSLMMISYKLQVENYSQMANDLILKIYKITNSLRQQGIKFPLAEELPTASEERCHC